MIIIISAGDNYRADMDLEANDDGTMMTKTVTITLSAAAGYMVLVVGLMLYCRYRRRRRKQLYLQEQTEGIVNINICNNLMMYTCIFKLMHTFMNSRKNGEWRCTGRSDRVEGNWE